MKVLLTVPDSSYHLKNYAGIVSLPLGLAYIASYLREFDNHEVLIYDCQIEPSGSKGFVKVLESFSPDVVGISGQASSSVYDVYRFARLVKKSNPQVLVIVGGAHVTFQDVDVLTSCAEIDVVVRGEGEVIMHNLVREYATNGNYTDVVGITYRSGQLVIRNADNSFIQDLDSIPLPAYVLFDLPKYFCYGVRFAPMISSRGCPFGCNFCSSSRVVGRRWRARSPENVVMEMEWLVNKYHLKDIMFLDDLFTLDTNRVKRICELIKEKGINVGWSCTARGNTLSSHPELAEWLIDAGCHTLFIGVESGSQRILDLMNKRIKLGDFEKSVKIAKLAGLNVLLSFMIGYPGETKKDIDTTIDFACRLDPAGAEFSICTPYPGTPLYEQALNNGWIRANDWRAFGMLEPVMELPGLSMSSLKRHLIRAYLKFYLRLGYLWQVIRKGNFVALKKRSILAMYINVIRNSLRVPK